MTRQPTINFQGCVSIRKSRRGGVSIAVVTVLGVFLAAVALAVDISHLWQANNQARVSADAAVLAAIQALVSDDVLTEKTGAMAACVQKAREQAIAFARANPVAGEPLELEPNLNNDLAGDITFCFMENPRTGVLQPASDLDSPHLNTIRVTARRTRARGNPAGMFFARFFGLKWADVSASATAVIDRDVIGFKPIGKQALPLAPIALHTDPKMDTHGSWDWQVVRPNRELNVQDTADKFVFDRKQKRFLQVPDEAPEGDGLFEMEVLIPLSGQPMLEQDRADANGCFLRLGAPSWEMLAKQIAMGVTGGDLHQFGGQFVLNYDNRLLVPGQTTGPHIDGADMAMLLNAFKTLEMTAEPRIWPLFLDMEDGTSPQSQAIVQGFVAGRLVRSGLVDVGEEKELRQFLQLIIQPCAMTAGAAITDYKRRHSNPAVSIYNPYICKVRLVE